MTENSPNLKKVINSLIRKKKKKGSVDTKYKKHKEAKKAD